MKGILMAAALVALVAGCAIGPATERLEKLGANEDTVRAQLVEAVQAGDEATADALREVLKSYADERAQLNEEAAKERETARQNRTGLLAKIMGGLGIAGSLLAVAVKKFLV